MQVMWKSLRRKKLRSAPFPTERRKIVEACCPFYHRLSEPDREELEGHIRIFLAEKKFEVCGGLELNDEIRVCIAAFACLLLLHRETDYYPSLQTVLVYPGTFVVPIVQSVGLGVMREGHRVLAGQSWRDGSVVLAWDQTRNAIRSPGSGFNVVLHEFAHQLDDEDGHTNGAPLLGHGESRKAQKRRYADWSRVMRAEFDRHRDLIQRGEPTLLREYGATNPAEFFAVATECFFGRPQELEEKHPGLYEQMKSYYRQDPARWMPFDSSD
jgi:MtfA peptidase